MSRKSSLISTLLPYSKDYKDEAITLMFEALINKNMN